MIKVYAAMITIIAMSGLPAFAVTIFETFDTDPSSRGWVNQSAGQTIFEYNPDGYVDALWLHRDSGNTGRFCKPFSSAINDTAEFWMEMDIVVLSSSTESLQACLWGLFGSSVDNHHSFLGTRFAYDNFNGTPNGQRFDMVSWDAAGVITDPKNTIRDEPNGLPYDFAGRVKAHYFVDAGQKKCEMNLYDIATGQRRLMHANPITIIPASSSVSFNFFGIGNRTDGTLRTAFQSLKVDNLYFSTDGPNLNPTYPSFGYFIFTGDLTQNGKVDFNDLYFLALRWLSPCSTPLWCDGADIDNSGQVELVDYSKLAQNWQRSSIPPRPLKLPAFFTDNMVIQRDSTVPIWGWAEPGENISVAASWLQSDSDIADANGRWRVDIPSPAAGGPYTITVQDSRTTLTLENVLSGDVWLCSGQSNMGFTTDRVLDAANVMAAANYPEIRFTNFDAADNPVPQEDVTSVLPWTEVSPSSVASLSAVAYFFGKYICDELDVPIGLIDTSRGGYPIAPFMSIETLESDPDFETQLHRTDKIAAGMYNSRIYPLKPYQLKGFLWYQGEADAGRAWLYRKLFKALIRNWRDDFGNNLSFYFVQLAPYNGSGSNAYPELREAQLMALSEPNTGMAVIHDTVTDLSNIHPPDKDPVGHRLALWAFAKDYGYSNLVFSGPIYSHMAIEGSQIRIFFDYTATGLVAKGGGALSDFTIAGSSQVFYPATAVINGDTVVVSSPSVPDPVSVRFGWTNIAQPNLYNDANLPASAFRTDDWPGITYNAR